ncbi:hypothetical protein M0813_14878 [Anaeramoeba flamelloides]|uniref:Uncharacterized protein n=1 Tax=Anaeramoeba flamelloides TaxID=1746091 RepID=A0ABQ8Z4G4_9EUKA|nr:hypothetical protein M0813_14878 [Anaeramoeba flamelloides]
MFNLIQVASLQEEKSVLLNNFRQETGSSFEDALSYLGVCNWDYQFSVGVYGLLGLKKAPRSKINFKQLNNSLVEMNEFFLPQSSEGEEETMYFTNRKREIETIYQEKCISPKERKIMLNGKVNKHEEPKNDPNQAKIKIETQKDEKNFDQIIKEETKLSKIDKLQNVLSQGFLSWDKRLRAIVNYDPELVVGYPINLKTKNQITIKKTIFDLLAKYSSKKVSKKNLQRGVHSFLAKFGFKNETKHNHNIMIFRSQN